MSRAKTKAIRLLLVDDHEMVRAGLGTLLTRSGIEVIGEADSADSALRQAVKLKPDVVLMDVQLAKSSGVEACREIRAACPDTRVLFLSSHVHEDAAMATVLGGAQGYLLKEIKKDALISAIKAVAQGQSIQDPTVTERIRQKVQGISEGVGGATEAQLSPQEQKVLAAVADGKTNKEIGLALGLTEKTVKNYLRNVFQKLQVTRRSQAVAKFTRRSLVKPPEEQ